MASFSRTSLVTTSLCAAAVGLSLVPITGQTQDVAPVKVDVANPIRTEVKDLEIRVAPFAPVAPVAPEVPRPPLPPGADARPDAAPRIADPNFAREIKGLADKIRKEVEEAVRREMEVNGVAGGDLARRSEQLGIKLSREIVEQLQSQRRALEDQRHGLEDQRHAIEEARRAVLTERHTLEDRRHDIENPLNSNIRLKIMGKANADDLRRKLAKNDRKLEQNTRELLSNFDKSTDTNRGEYIEKLTKLVSEQFEVKQAAREQELKQLEDQFRKLKAVHEQRAREKKDIVQDRVRQLLRKAAGMDWDGRALSADEHHDEFDEDDNEEGEVIEVNVDQRP